jgi:hypothetical protein
MPRPCKTDRPVEKNISLPTSTVARVELELFSELEGKVPFGAWQKFLVGLIDGHFARKRVFTAAGFPGFNPVGTAATIIAESPERALALLNQVLYAKGLAPAKLDCLRELPVDAEGCLVLCDGDY